MRESFDSFAANAKWRGFQEATSSFIEMSSTIVTSPIDDYHSLRQSNCDSFEIMNITVVWRQEWFRPILDMIKFIVSKTRTSILDFNLKNFFSSNVRRQPNQNSQTLPHLYWDSRERG